MKSTSSEVSDIFDECSERGEIADLKSHFGPTGEGLKELYGPEEQFKYYQHYYRCFWGSAPTLSRVAAEYGEAFAIDWLGSHIDDLSEYCGCKSLTGRQVNQLCRLIILRFGHFRLTEFMIFFVNFKNGLYGKMFSSMDPIKITTSLAEFTQERGRTKMRLHELEEEKRQREEIEEFIRLRERYEARIPHAYTEEASVTLFQYQMLLDRMSDAEMEKFLAEWGGGTLLPEGIDEVCGLRRRLLNSLH